MVSKNATLLNGWIFSFRLGRPVLYLCPPKRSETFKPSMSIIFWQDVPFKRMEPGYISKARPGLLLPKYRRCEMENVKEDITLLVNKILKTFDQFEQEKEQKLVNLFIEIIVSSTLKEYYEKGD
jgi:hypothetical protein